MGFIISTEKEKIEVVVTALEKLEIDFKQFPLIGLIICPGKEVYKKYDEIKQIKGVISIQGERIVSGY